MNYLAVLTQTQDPSGSRMFDHFLEGGGHRLPGRPGGFVRLNDVVGPGWREAKVLAVSKETVTLLVFPGQHDKDDNGRPLAGVEQIITRQEWRARGRSLGFMEGGKPWFGNMFPGLTMAMLGIGATVVVGTGAYLWRYQKSLAPSAGSAAVDPYKRRDDLRRMAAQTSGASPGERATALRQLAKVQASLPARSDEDLLRDLGVDEPLPTWREGQARRARTTRSDAVSLDPLEAAVGFGRRASYDGEMKAEWKRRAMAVLHQVAKDLYLAPGTFTVIFNPGGIAVPGDAILHHDRVYVNLEPSMFASGVGYARRCAGQKDYGGKWGPGWENHDIPSSYEGLVRLVRDLLEPAHA